MNGPSIKLEISDVKSSAESYKMINWYQYIWFRIFSVEPYFLGGRGDMKCIGGLVITDAVGCRTACRFLEITLGGIFREGKTCYMAKNGKCRQDGRHGSKVSLPCKTSGKQT